MKKLSKSAPLKSVDDYLALQPVPVREVLEQLRHTIRKAAPKAEEVISYQMPGYKLNGMLVYFAAFKTHCSFFPGSRIVKSMKEELKGFKTATGTIQFTIDHPIPATLVRKMVKARIAENLEKAAKRKNAKA